MLGKLIEVSLACAWVLMAGSFFFGCVLGAAVLGVVR